MNDKSIIRGKKPSPGLIAGLFVALFFGVSLFIRAYLPYDQIFSGEWVKFSGNDAYIQMRLVDSLVHNFPRLIDFDPYLLYPFGMRLDNIHFFNWLLAGVIWAIGLGAPTQHTIDVVGAYFPTVLAALTVIPVYFIGKELFGRWAGVIAAGLVAILPGEYLGRSILGFTDHHVAETLFTTIAIMFFIMAIKRAQESGLTVQHLRNRDGKVIRKPLILSLFAGLSLGLYLVTWIGGLLFVFIILLYLFIQFIIDHLKRNRTDYLLPAGTITFFIALIIYVIFAGSTFSLKPLSVIPWLALLMATVLPIILHLVSAEYVKTKIRPYYYPITLFGVGAIAIAVVSVIAPSYIRYAFDVFNPIAVRTIMEMQPFLRPQGEWTAALAWGNFNANFFLFPGASPLPEWFQWIPGFSFISLVILIVSIIKHGNADKNILVIWSLIVLFATLGQRRFAYYLIVNVALLTSFLSWQFFKMNQDVRPYVKHINIFASIATIIILIFFSGFNPIIVAILVALLIAYIFWQFLQVLDILRFTNPKLEPQKKRKHKGKSTAGFSPALYHINMAMAGIVIFSLVFSPSINPAIALASQAQFAPSDAWIRSLDWMRENTPEPFGDPDFYYQIYEPPPAGEQYDYPDSSYAVMAWVDYGYWITRIAHRPVNLTPGPGGFYVATFLLSQSENSSQEVEWQTEREQEMIPESDIINKLGTKYIMLDDQIVTSKFWALGIWSEQELSKFFDFYLEPREKNVFARKAFFHPEYYRSLGVRLYYFDGKAVTPPETVVISYEERPFQGGGMVKVITDTKTFPSYQEANDYISAQKSGDFQIVSDTPSVSPVPLEELKHYQLVYRSPETTYQPGVGNVPSIKIFEYIK